MNSYSALFINDSILFTTYSAIKIGEHQLGRISNPSSWRMSISDANHEM